MLPTLLVSLLAFLVDILLFVPHLGWGGWIVLASTILIVLSGVLTCAMRRTIVSRKARKKRIAENAEMSGENFFNRQNSAPTAPPLSQQPTAPIVNGSSNSNALPSFATYDQKQRISDDDRTPLNSRSATGISSNGIRPSTADDGMDRYAAGRGGSFSSQGSRGRGGRMYNGPRDEYGNPMPPSGAYGGGMRGPDGQYPRKQYSNETMSSQNSRGRGRGGYPPRGYGRGGPYGGGRGGRGGMAMGAMAAGGGMMAGEMMGRGQRGPPPGYNNGYPPQGRAGPGQYGQSAYGQRISPGPPGYGRNPSPGPPSRPGLEQPENGLARAESPPPLPGQNPSYPAEIGQAIEMDASTGSPANTPGFPPPNNALRESDSDVQGLVGLQQSRAAGQEPLHSPSSNYSQAE